MRARCSVLAVMMTLAFAATAHATNRPLAGFYAGQAHFNGSPTHTVTIHVFADQQHASLSFSHVVITPSAPLTLEDGHWTFSVHDENFRARATWATVFHVLGSLSRTRDPRSVPSMTFSATLHA